MLSCCLLKPVHSNNASMQYPIPFIPHKDGSVYPLFWRIHLHLCINGCVYKNCCWAGCILRYTLRHPWILLLSEREQRAQNYTQRFQTLNKQYKSAEKNTQGILFDKKTILRLKLISWLTELTTLTLNTNKVVSWP